MLKNLKLDGTLNGSFEGHDFRIEVKDLAAKIYFTKLETLKFLKDQCFHRLKEYKDDPKFKEIMEIIDVEVYLENDLIARLGKNAKSNFISSIIGISHLEIVANGRMSDLMSLM